MKKKEIEYGVVGIFVLVALALIILMVPFEPVTYTVADVTGYATGDFISQNIVLMLVVFLVAVFAIAGIIFLIKKYKEHQIIISRIPPDQLKRVEDYIKSTIAKGYSRDDIKKALVDSGWQERQAEALLHEL